MKTYLPLLRKLIAYAKPAFIFALLLLTCFNLKASATTVKSILKTKSPLFDTPVISSIAPVSGPVGTVVTIKGSGFTGATAFSIGIMPGVIISNTGETITGVVMGSVSGAVSVTNGNTVTGSVTFNITPGPVLPLAKVSPKLIDPATGSINADVAQGYSVAISADGNTAVVGAPNYQNNNGALLIYTRDANDNWVKQGLTLNNPTTDPSLGAAVYISADGNYVMAGGNGNLAATCLFARNGTTWSLRQNWGANKVAALSGDGNTAVVGEAFESNISGVDVNGVPLKQIKLTIYKRGIDSLAIWTVITRPSDYAVVSISVDGRTILFANPYEHTPSGRFATTAYGGSTLITINGNSLNTTLIRSALYAGHFHEGIVANLSGDGKVAVIAAQDGRDGVVFRRNADNTWTESGTMPTGGAPVSLNMDGNIAYIQNSANFYKYINGIWVSQGFNPQVTGSIKASAITPDGTKFIAGLPNDGANKGAVQILSVPVVVPATVPTLSSNSLKFTNTITTGTTVSWARGNGAARVVFIAKVNSGYASPITGTAYVANTVFGNSPPLVISNGTWYCVYNGTGDSVKIDGLTQGTTYRVTVVEYNGANTAQNYKTDQVLVGTLQTPTVNAPVPTIPALNVTFTNTTTSSTRVSWKSGNGANRAVFIAQTGNGVAGPVNNSTYIANTAFSSGIQIGTTGWYCIYNGKDSTVNISGLLSKTTYRVTVVEYNGAAGAEQYMNTKLAPASVITLTNGPIAPTVPSLQLTFTNTTASNTTVSWNSGNGTSRAVFVAKTANGVANPLDNTRYTANASFAGGTQIGATGWYCIYNGTGSSVNISGLLANTTYRVTTVEYNGTTGAEKYMNTKLNPASVITLPSALAAPTVPSLLLTFTNTTSTNTTVSWNSGNGAARAVFVAQTAYGLANPLDNTHYTANTTFAGGTQIGATGWYCVYNGTGSSVNISGLLQNTIYRVTTVEYNGVSGAEKYMNTKLNPASVITVPSQTIAPTVPSLKLTFTNTSNASTTVSWNSGNGAARAVFIAQTGNGVINAADNITYTPNTSFAAGTQVGSTGWYCIYNGTGSSVSVTGLQPSTIYRVTTIEYNGASGGEKYMNTKLNPASVITTAQPLIVVNKSGYQLSVAGSATGDTKIEAANILTPNGDGKNDTWIVKNIELYPNNTVTVYSQASGVVYTKKGYANDWAGTFGGSVLNEGTYYYLIDLGQGSTYKGFITVLRNR